MKLKAIEFTQKLGRENILEIPAAYHAELRTIPNVRVILLYEEEPPIRDWEMEAFDRFVVETKDHPMPIEGK